MLFDFLRPRGRTPARRPPTPGPLTCLLRLALPARRGRRPTEIIQSGRISFPPRRPGSPVGGLGGATSRLYRHGDNPEPKQTEEFALRIESDPQFALGLSALSSIIQGAQVSVHSPSDDPRAQALAYNLTQRWHDSVAHALKAFGRGRAAFELWYEWDSVRKLHLLGGLEYLEFADSSLRLDEAGHIAGVDLKVGDKRHRLPAKNCWWFALDATPSCPHGKSRYLGAPYRIWKARRALERNYDAWLDKFALGHGVLKAPSQYPPLWKNSQSGYADSNLDGTPADPLEDGERLLAELRSGGVAVLPSETDEHGAPLWSYEPPSIRQDAGPLERRQTLLDAYALRSLGIPERAVTQDASTGSYAMAEVHWRVLLSTCEGVLSQMASSFQRQVVQRVETVNAPPNRRWNLKLVWQKLDPALSALAMDLVRSILQSPKPSPLVLHGVVDLAKLLEIVRLPTGDRLAERIEQVRKELSPPAPPQPALSQRQTPVELARMPAGFQSGEATGGRFASDEQLETKQPVPGKEQGDEPKPPENAAAADEEDEAEPEPVEEPEPPDPRDEVKKTTVIVHEDGRRVSLTLWNGWTYWAKSLGTIDVGSLHPNKEGEIDVNIGRKVFVLDKTKLEEAVANHEIRSQEDFEAWALTHCLYDLNVKIDKKFWGSAWADKLASGSMPSASDPLRTVLEQANLAGPAVEQLLKETAEKVVRGTLKPVDAAMTLFEAAKVANEHKNETAAAALAALALYLIYRKTAAARRIRDLNACFPPDVLVATPSGPKRIQTVSPNDVVSAYDAATGLWRSARVLRRHRQEFVGVLRVIETSNGVVEATASHPVWVEDGDDVQHRRHEDFTQSRAPRQGWVEAGRLRPGDQLLTLAGCDCTIEGVRSRAFRGTVYNLEIDVLQTYAVGEAGVLVHNKPAVARPGRPINPPKFGPASGSKPIPSFDKHLREFETDALGNKYPGKRMPGATNNTHAHHIVMKGKNYPGAAESREILERYNIDWYAGKENLIWAPNVGHSMPYAKEVYEALKKADETKGSREAVVAALKKLGDKFVQTHTKRK